MRSLIRAVPAGMLAVLVGAGAPLTASAAPPAPPSHVAVVVAGQRSACVPWHAGLSGLDVLAAAGFELGYNSSGLITQIDGVPSDPDPYRSYWAYFRDTGSGWVYSGRGPASTRPAAGTVEGWALESATSQEHPPPPPASYGSICAGKDRPPRADPTHRSPSTAPGAPSAARTHPPAARTHPPDRSSPARTPSRQPTPGTAHSAAPGRATATGSAGAEATTPTTTPTPTPTARSVTATSAIGAAPSSSPAAATTSGGGSGLPTLATGVAVAVIVALGGVAFWRSRGSRGP